MSEANKAVARRYAEAILKHDLTLYDEFFSVDSVYHGPNLPELRGPEARKQFYASLIRAFPDVHLTVDELIAEGDKVVSCWSATGTHRGEWWGSAPSGKKLSWSGTSTLRVAGGKIVDESIQWDALGFMQQLGLAPTTIGQFTATAGR